MSDYVELRAKSAFSFLEATSNPEDLATRAAELGHTALALGDRDGLSGMPRFHTAAKSAGLRALVGAELLDVEGRPLLLLATSRAGYRHLAQPESGEHAGRLLPRRPLIFSSEQIYKKFLHLLKRI